MVEGDQTAGDGVDADAPDVDALLAAARAGSAAAYGVLYTEHRTLALNRARRLLGARRNEAEDVVEVAFAAIFDAMRNGKGPKDHFDRYLLVTIRRHVWRTVRKLDRETALPPEDVDTATTPVEGPTQWVAADDRSPEQRAGLEAMAAAAATRLDAALLLTDAFRGLNERFRAVLWMTEVEGREPAEVAELLDLSANSAAALAYRARKALRHGYFEAYGATTAAPACVPLVGRLEAYAEGGFDEEGFGDVTDHAGGCPSCTDVLRGAARSGSMLAVALPFGMLTSGYWLRPGRPNHAAVGEAGGGSNGRRWLVAAAVLLLLLLGGAAAALRGGEHEDALRSSGPDPTVAPSPSPSPSPSPPTAPDRTTTMPSAGPSTSTTTARPGTTTTRPASVPTTPSTVPAVPPATSLPSVTTGAVRGVVQVDRDGSGPGPAAPAAGVPVTLVRDGTSTVVAAGVSAIDGAVQLDRVPPGSYRVRLAVPTGVIPAGSSAVPPAGGAMHTVDAGIVAVSAGSVSSLPVELVPWRTLSASSLGVDDASATVGQTITWTYRVAVSPEAASSAQAVVALPATGVGVRLVRATFTPSGGAARVLTCAASAGSSSCRLPHLGPQGGVLSVEVEVLSGSGTVRSTLALDPGRGYATAASASGPVASVS